MSRHKRAVEKANGIDIQRQPNEALMAFLYGRHKFNDVELACLALSMKHDASPHLIDRVKTRLLSVMVDAFDAGSGDPFRRFADALDDVLSRAPKSPAEFHLLLAQMAGTTPRAKDVAKSAKVNERTIRRVAKKLNIALDNRPGRPPKAR